MSGGGKRVLGVPLPRVVHGTMPRCRTPEQVVVLDDVPVLVPDLADGEAPVALVAGPPPGSDPDAHGSGAYRISGSDWYLPVEYGAAPGGCTPDGFGAALAGRIARAVGLDDGGDPHDRQEMADWAGLLGRTATRRGLLPAAAGPMRVRDDGRAAQAALAAHVAGNLAVIGGRVHHRVPAPAYRVVVGDDMQVSVRRELAPMTPYGSRPVRAEWASTFAITRLSDARRLADVMAGQEELQRGRDDPPYDVLSPWEVTASGMAPEEASPVAVLSLAFMDYADACRDVAGHLDDDGLALYLAFRSGKDWGSFDEGIGALERLAEALYRADVRYCEDEALRRRLPHDAFRDVYVAHTKITQRLQAIEGPLWGLSEDDLDAMATLGAGP